ncbi:MAG: four helix bundle protein [Bacteroidota bacterium]|nr:four helix bundle protein [Bacteroidota bacterium]
MRSFEELRVWQDARLLVEDIYKSNSSCKDYGFKDQIQRASISIMNNIAEGSESGSDALFIRYLNTAKASCGEVRSMLYAGEDLTYYSIENATLLRDKTIILSSALHKFIEYLRKSRSNEKSSKNTIV